MSTAELLRHRVVNMFARSFILPLGLRMRLYRYAGVDVGRDAIISPGCVLYGRRLTVN